MILTSIRPEQSARENGGALGLITPSSPREYTPTCTVVVCTRDRPIQLEQCLDAVGRLVYPDFDVLVVDNASSDARTREVAERSNARYLSEPTVGLSRARNLAFRVCDKEIVAFLDDDALPNPDWLSGLAREFADPQVMAVVGGKRALSVETEAERLCASIESAPCRGQERLVVDRLTPFWFERANFGGIGDGMNMAFRRRAIELWPGFDERLGRGAILHGGEEHHAFFSLIDRGYRVVHTPHALVRHPYPRTLQELRARQLNDFASSTGYLSLLLAEEPRYRRAVVKYVFEALRAKPRWWRGQATKQRLRVAPRWRMLLACLKGPILYLLSRPMRHPVGADELSGLPQPGSWRGSPIESPAQGTGSLD